LEEKDVEKFKDSGEKENEVQALEEIVLSIDNDEKEGQALEEKDLEKFNDSEEIFLKFRKIPKKNLRSGKSTTVKKRKTKKVKKIESLIKFKFKIFLSFRFFYFILNFRRVFIQKNSKKKLNCKFSGQFYFQASYNSPGTL
jgi:negative regulator of genetic competence, sporulation and motility